MTALQRGVGPASVALAAGLLAACGTVDESPRDGGVSRWLEQPPAAILRPAAALAAANHREFRPVTSWSAEQGKAEDRLRFVAAAGWQAAEVDGVRVGFRGLRARRGLIRLLWAAPGEDFRPARRTQVEITPQARNTYTFELLMHPKWRGSIARIAIEFPGDPASPPRVRATPVRFGLDQRKLPALAAETWNLEIGDDLRAGVVTPPGSPRTWTVEGSDSGARRLSFAFGLVGPGVEPVRFRLSQQDAAGDPAVVFEEVVAGG